MSGWRSFGLRDRGSEEEGSRVWYRMMNRDATKSSMCHVCCESRYIFIKATFFSSCLLFGTCRAELRSGETICIVMLRGRPTGQRRWAVGR